jgi:hypothetical protein
MVIMVCEGRTHLHFGGGVWRKLQQDVTNTCLYSECTASVATKFNSVRQSKQDMWSINVCSLEASKLHILVKECPSNPSFRRIHFILLALNLKFFTYDLHHWYRYVSCRYRGEDQAAIIEHQVRLVSGCKWKEDGS